MEPVTSVQRTAIGPVEVNRHADPVVVSAGGEAGETAVEPGQGPSVRSLAEDCAPVNSPLDDTENAFHPPNSRVLKVIYAYPTDVGNRLATYGPVIQTGMRWVAELAAGESGNLKSLGIDLGTPSGSACVDVQTVALDGARSSYTATPSKTFSLLKSELLPEVRTQTGARNFVVYADGISVPGVGGEAQIRSDNTVSGSAHAIGGLWAMLYGRGGTDFFGSSTSYAPGTTSRSHVDLALHEISHTMGAVQPGAPHASAAWHCLDEADILCYDDDGWGGLSTYIACDSPSNQRWDCNNDDYFNPAPPPGSYIATHWNLFNSVFMCPADGCAPGGVSGPPSFPATTAAPASVAQMAPATRIAAGPSKPTRKRRATFRFTSSRPGSTFRCAIDGRAYSSCASPLTLRKLSGGKHVFRVYAVAPDGTRDRTAAVRGFRVKGKRGRARRAR